MRQQMALESLDGWDQLPTVSAMTQVDVLMRRDGHQRFKGCAKFSSYPLRSTIENSRCP